MTTSTDDSAAAAPGSYSGRVNMVRQSSNNESRPSASSVPINVTYIPPRASPEGATRLSSPKRQLDRYKPTVEMVGMQTLFYDPRITSTGWRVFETGCIAKVPPGHRQGEEFHGLPAPPNYNPVEQHAELKRRRGISEPIPKSVEATVAVMPKEFGPVPKNTGMPSLFKPPTTPRRQGRDPVRRVSKSPSTTSYMSYNTSFSKVDSGDVLQMLDTMGNAQTTAVAKIKRLRTISASREIADINSLVTSEDQIRVDRTFAEIKVMDGVVSIDRATQCYSELSNSRSEVALLQSALKRATDANKEMSESFRTSLDESQSQLSAVREQLGNESFAASQMHVAEAKIKILEDQLKAKNFDDPEGRALREALNKAQQDLINQVSRTAEAEHGAMESRRVIEEVRRIEKNTQEMLDNRFKHEESMVRKLQVSNDTLREQLLMENSKYLEEKIKADNQKAEAQAEIADLRLSLQSRRGNHADVARINEELVAEKRENQQQKEEIAKLLENESKNKDRSKSDVVLIQKLSEEIITVEGKLKKISEEKEAHQKSAAEEIHDLQVRVAIAESSTAVIDPNAAQELKDLKAKVIHEEMECQRIKKDSSKGVEEFNIANQDAVTRLVEELKEAQVQEVRLLRKVHDWKDSHDQWQDESQTWEDRCKNEEKENAEIIAKLRQENQMLETAMEKLSTVKPAPADRVNRSHSSYDSIEGNPGDLNQYKSELAEAKGELSNARREIDTLTSQQKLWDSKTEVLRSNLVDLQNKNNELKHKILNDKIQEERSSLGWSYVGSIDTPNKAEAPLTPERKSPTIKEESHDSVESTPVEQSVDRDGDSPEGRQHAEYSQQHMDMSRMEMWMEARMLQQAEAVQEAVRRSESAEAAAQKRSRSVDFKQEKEEIKEVQTTLTAQARPGDTRIEVASNEEFPIGCQITIGTVFRNEVRTVTGHGSLIFDRPLRHTYEVGTYVSLNQADWNYDEWHEWYNGADYASEEEDDDDNPDGVNITINGNNTPNNSDFEESDTSNGSGKVKVHSGGGANYKDFKFRWSFPMVHNEVDEYHDRLCEEVLRVSPRTDSKDREYYDRIRSIKDFTKPHPWLDRVPRRHVRMDREVRLKLEESVKDRHELVNIITCLRTDHRARQKELTSRRLIVQLYSSLAINNSLFDVIGIKSITSLSWWGDSWANEWYTEFMRRYTMMNRTENSLSEIQVRDILHHELTKSMGHGSIEYDLRDWNKLPKNEKTLTSLLQVYKDWIRQKQIRKNNTKSLADDGRGLRKKDGKKNDKHYGLDQELPHRDGKGKDGKGKGKGKGKHKGKGKDGKGGEKGKGKDKGKGKGKEKGDGKGKNNRDSGGNPNAPPSPPHGGGNASRRASSSRRDEKGKPLPITNDKGHRINLCWWYQTKYNGAYTCSRNQKDCAFLHEQCKSRAEFDDLKRPRAESPAPPKPKPKPKPKAKGKSRENSPSGKAKADP